MDAVQEPAQESGGVVGVALVGGRGERARPITVKAPGYLRSKAAMSFCGKRIIRWLIEIMKSQGIDEFIVVALGKENRYQTKTLVGFGEAYGVRVRYSRVRHDTFNTGSADATLRTLDDFDITGPALVFPTDSLFDFSLAEMLETHSSNRAIATVAAMARGPEQVAGKYGVMLTDVSGRISEFVEKPSLTELRSAFPTQSPEEFEKLPLLTNAGIYLLDSAAARKYGQEPGVTAIRSRRLDFGLDLLPRMVGAGLPVYAHPASRTGDLGTVIDYIDTMVAMLRGRFKSLAPLMGEPFDLARRIWIPIETLQQKDDVSGKTLEEKLEEGLVRIGDNVRLGRYVEIGPGVTIVDSNIDDGVDIGPNVDIRRSAIRDGAIIGPHAALSDAYLGSMVELRSSAARRTVLEGYVAVGDEAIIQRGAQLVGRISIYPRVKIPFGVSIPDGAEVRDSDDVLKYL
jgi:NDP-sugar pyrophosphorylase family protein